MPSILSIYRGRPYDRSIALYSTLDTLRDMATRPEQTPTVYGYHQESVTGEQSPVVSEYDTFQGGGNHFASKSVYMYIYMVYDLVLGTRLVLGTIGEEMGYYIQTDGVKNKAAYIVQHHDGQQLLEAPDSFEDIPEGKALIVVVDNRVFEAAGLCYDKGEFRAFTDPEDTRNRQYVLLDKVLAYKLAGYTP